MSSRRTSLFCLALLLAFCSGIQAFNITRLLGQYPEFGAFNQYITEAKLADQINGRRTITILAVSDSSIASISGRSKDSIKAIISTHVILDYFDEKKLMELQGSSAQLTTLYQTTGLAIRRQGFINVALIGEGEIVFGSAVKGAPLNSKLVKTVTTQPFNISVLQVTQPIIPPGIDTQSPWPAPGAETPLPHGKPTTPSGDDEDQVFAEPPEDAEAAAPVSAAPTPAPVTAPAPGPVADDKTADDEGSAPSQNGSSRTQIGLVGASVMGLACLFVAL